MDVTHAVRTAERLARATSDPLGGQHDDEARAAARAVLHPDAAAVHLHVARDDGQAEAHPARALPATVFSLPGLGKAAIDAIGQQDLPVIIGIVLFASAAVVAANIVVDLLYAVLDPRVRLH